jgi:hypothetical protein
VRRQRADGLVNVVVVEPEGRMKGFGVSSCLRLEVEGEYWPVEDESEEEEAEEEDSRSEVKNSANMAPRLHKSVEGAS